MTHHTLVIGATGKTGRRIVRQLLAAGHPVRGVSRSTAPRFDWDDPGTWPDALAGASTVYVAYVPDLAAPEAPATLEALVDEAGKAGVERLVLLSGRGEPNARRCEQVVRDGGLGWTILRASWFSQNFSEGLLLPAVLEGTIALPAGDVAEPFVDIDDLADVAVAALVDDRHAGREYELTGPRLLTLTEAAAEIGAAAGHPVHYEPVSSEAFRAAVLADLGPRQADLLTDICQVFDGRNASLGDGVQQVLGRAPRDFADFCAACAAAGVWAR
jgi:uncharacterized protein YbjT (DUF2867 family)